MSSTATVMTTTAKPWAEREHPFSPSYLPLDKAFRVYARHGKQQDPRPELTPRTRSTVSSKDPSAPVVSFTKEPMSAVVPTHKDPGTLTTSRKSFQHLGLELNTWDDFLWRWNVWIQSNTCLYVMYPGEQLFFCTSLSSLLSSSSETLIESLCSIDGHRMLTLILSCVLATHCLQWVRSCS